MEPCFDDIRLVLMEIMATGKRNIVLLSSPLCSQTSLSVRLLPPFFSPHLQDCDAVGFLIIFLCFLILALPPLACRMLAKSPALPLVTAETPALGFCATYNLLPSLGVKFSKKKHGGRSRILHIEFRKCRDANALHRKWRTLAADQAQPSVVDTGESKTCEECKQMLTALNFSNEDADKMLRKAFGWIHSPFWSEERKKEVPNAEVVSGVLNYVRSLGLSDDDLHKSLKKFPEVLGCDVDSKVKLNVSKLDSDWGINGKTLRSVLLRNPKVLGNWLPRGLHGPVHPLLG